MRIAVLTNEDLAAEWCLSGIESVQWYTDPEAFGSSGAAIFFDFLFEPGPERMAWLRTLRGKVAVNAVAETLDELPEGVARLNAWPGSGARPAIEMVTGDGSLCWEEALRAMGKKIISVPDQPGMIAPRVISMIVNEAYFAYGENVSSEEDINTAMKLGTNYPYGPFEWGAKIGLSNIHRLLKKLAAGNPLYAPAPALEAAWLNEKL